MTSGGASFACDRAAGVAPRRKGNARAIDPTQRGGLLRLDVGGLLGLMAGELFARFATPIFVGGPLDPAALVTSRWVLNLGTLGTLGDGLLWGVATWILALGVSASLVGLPFMLGWIPLTWFSLVGHVIYAVVADQNRTRRRRSGGRRWGEWRRSPYVRCVAGATFTNRRGRRR